MRVNEIVDPEQPKYAIQIMIHGNIGRAQPGTIILYYKRNRLIPLETARHSQDFCAMKGQPTLFTDKDLVISRAKEVQKVCNRLRHDLASTQNFEPIHRDFFVKPVIWKGQTIVAPD